MRTQLESESPAEITARLHFEMMLADLCADFVNGTPQGIDATIENAQRVICKSLGVDHSSVWQASEESPGLFVMTHAYRDPSLEPLPVRPSAQDYFPWCYRKILNKEITCVPNTAALPPEAARDKESWEQYGIHSALVFPLSVGGGAPIGSLAFDCMRKRNWSETLQRRLQVLAHIFAQALHRKNAAQTEKMAREGLRTSEERLRLAQRAARFGAFERNVASGAVSWTTELERMYGLLPGEFDGTTTDFFKSLLHPEDRDRVMSLTNRATKTGEPTSAEWRIIWPDGSVHWIAGWWQVFMDQSGKPSRMIGINTDITERKRREEKLREYERAIENTEEMIAVLDREYRYLIANRQFLKIRNMTQEQVVGRAVYEILKKDVFEAIIKPKLDACFDGKVIRYEMKYSYPAIGERDLLVSYFPSGGAEGIDRVICILQDITERKRAEEALAGMSGRLIAAQEEERGRIARDLHDDIAQRLALLAIQHEELENRVLDPELRESIDEIRKQVVEISGDVQKMSHELHSSKLEYLGLVAAARSFCREFGERQRMKVDFTSRDLPGSIAPEISLCLFRIIQEALRNAARHSGSRHFNVQLWASAGQIHLLVGDRGLGFDIRAALKGPGLGLTSMKERLRLVNGELTIESQPKHGTTIRARVPISSRKL